MNTYNIKKFKIRDTFAKYGLDVDKNMLETPVDKNGNKHTLVLNTHHDIHSFCFTVLYDEDCCHCAVCVVPKDTIPYMVIKYIDEDDNVNISVVSTSDLRNPRPDGITDFFVNMDNDMNFHYLGLIVERDNHIWDVIEK